MSLYLIPFLLLSAPRAFAQSCGDIPKISPCMPSQSAQDLVVDLIKKAQADDGDVGRLKTAFLAARRGADKAAALAACGAYRDAKNAQDMKFKAAMNAAESAYRVGPDERTKTVAMPSDPRGEWVARMTKPAKWDPQVVDSGSGVYHTFLIKTSDGVSHYVSQEMSTDYSGFTAQDGEVVIEREAFDRAVTQNKAGVLARALFHETRHFNYLSRRVAGESGRRGWASKEEDERDAYIDDAGAARSAFGLSDADFDIIDGQRAKYVREAGRDAHGNQIKRTSQFPTDAQSVLGEMRYDQQLNLDAEYEKLQREVQAQQEQQLKDAIAADDERKAEQERSFEEAIRACGFTPSKNENGALEGYKSTGAVRFSFYFQYPVDTEQLKVGLMLANRFVGMVGKRTLVPPCVDNGLEIVNRRLGEPGFRDSLKLLGPAASKMAELADSLYLSIDLAGFNRAATPLLRRMNSDQDYFDSNPAYPKPQNDDPPARNGRDPDRAPRRPCHMVTTHLDGRQECW